MTAERLDPGCVMMVGGTEEDVRQYIESDHKIRSGLCPNGHGLMMQTQDLQECEVCHFITNVKPDTGPLQ